MTNLLSISAADVYQVACRAQVSEIDAMLTRMPSRARLQSPLAIALRGIRNAVTGDVPGGIAMLRRSASHAEEPDRQYIVDLLVPFLLSLGEIDEAEALLRTDAEPVPELYPGQLAFRSWAAARKGRDLASGELAAQSISLARLIDNRNTLGRIMQRLAFAAYFREHYDESQERAIESARAAEEVGAYRLAAGSYSLLYVIAKDIVGDADLSRMYAERVALTGERAGDVALQNLGLLAQLEIAASSGDHRRLGSIRARVLANPRSEQYRERFGFVMAEVLLNIWASRFQQARAMLFSISQAPARSLQELSLCDALLALLDAARWDVGPAKSRSHRVISQTAHHPNPEPLYDASIRRTARVVAAAACIIVGDVARGKRALTRFFDPDGSFARFAADYRLDEEAVEPMQRGYVRAINIAAETATRHAPRAGLTRTEMEILRVLPDGSTFKEIASSFGKSERTIAKHVEGIYEKLGVSNRTQAIKRARELGIPG